MDTTARTERRAIWLSASLAVTGLLVLAALALLQSVPDNVSLWLLLAAAYVALDFSSVEVNERVRVSSSAMVAFAAAVIFGRESAMLAVTAMAALAAVHPDDVVHRRWRRPAANLGVLVVAAASAMAVFSPFLPEGDLRVGDLPRLALGAAIAAIAFDWIGFRLVRFATRFLYPDQDLVPWSRQIVNHLALSVLAAFGALIGAAYDLVGSVVLPLMAVTFLVGQGAFSSYARLREAHLATVAGFVKAIEALDRHTKGHTDRVVHFVQITASRLGLEPERQVLLRWAASVHDVGKVAVPGDLLRAAEQPGGQEVAGLEERMRAVDDLLRRVDFLAPIMDLVTGARRLSGGAGEPIETRVLAAADAFDGMTATRSHRRAVTQAQAFAALREASDVYGTDVVEALIGAIEDRHEVYGLPDEDSAAEVDRLIRERSIRA
jgi:HD-GYP domain-containing protein (c-di-GMP phosphodiesterase class II)